MEHSSLISKYFPFLSKYLKLQISLWGMLWLLPEIMICWIFIFIQSTLFSNYPFDFFLWPMSDLEAFPSIWGLARHLIVMHFLFNSVVVIDHTPNDLNILSLLRLESWTCVWSILLNVQYLFGKHKYYFVVR